MNLKSKERNIWFTSDTHYSHKNLIKNLSTWSSGAHRDFKSVDEHNSIMVNNINKIVGQDDILFHLGDVAFGGFDNIKLFMDQLICNEVHLILGNHDNHIKTNRNDVKKCFTSVSLRNDVYIDGELFVLHHYPIAEWEAGHKGSYHLYGHQHNLPKDRFRNGGRSMDVGLDGHSEFRPYHYNEIIKILKDKYVIKHH